jgi:hypothetical protein
MVRQSPICAHIPTSLDRQRPAYRALCWDHNIKEPALSCANCSCVDDGLLTVHYCSATTTDGFGIFRKYAQLDYGLCWRTLNRERRVNIRTNTSQYGRVSNRQQWPLDICGLVAWTKSSDRLLEMRYKLAQPHWKPEQQHHSQRKQSKQQARRPILHYTSESDLESEARC